MNVSIVYCSCYMYRNLWKPFLELKSRYCVNDSIPFYLCTDGPMEEIRALVGTEPRVIRYESPANNNTNYITRVISYLKAIDTKYVIFWYDDMFLTGNVDWKLFQQAHALMEQNAQIKLIKLSECSYPFTGGIQHNLFQSSAKGDSYILNVQPTLFDRSFLLSVMEEVEKQPVKNGPSDFETYGSEIANKLPFVYLRSISNIIPVFHEGGVVRSGIVWDEARAFLRREGVHIDVYEKNCIYDLTSKSNVDTLNHQLKWELQQWFQINV